MAALFASHWGVLTCVAVLLLPGLSSQTSEFSPLDVLRSRVTPGDQAQAVRDLITRLIPSRAEEFDVIVDPYIGPINKDTFKLISVGNRVQITGTSGVAAAWGLQHYLKYYCGCHVSWGGVQVSTIPSPLPSLPTSGLTVTSNDRFRYYQNVCTVSYSFVWWRWERWEQEIDWMALNAINLPLAFNGQEAIFQRVYQRLGFSQADLDEFFVGPAFLAWGRMGNIEAFAGPLSASWHKEQLALQHKILDRMRSLGMLPILPGFAGHVPPATSRLFPNSSVTRLGDWAGFNATFSSTYLLSFSDTLFQTIGKMYIEEMESEFGSNHLYSADTFNEMQPKSSEPSYVASAGRAVYSAMATADPQAIWVMQGWLFLEGFWQPPQAQALLNSVDKGKMLILDLMSELEPQYVRLKSYYGQPFIWCMLHNFGGNLELYGTMPRVNTEPFYGRTFSGSTMVGIGLTPEGILQNDVMYEFMNENAWRTVPRDINLWVQEYSARRYGGKNVYAEKAWTLLARSVYNYTKEIRYHGKIGIIKRPSLKLKPILWYLTTDLRDAWSGLVNASSQFGNSDLFRYDLVDVTRESLQHVSIHLYTEIVKAYQQKNVSSLQVLGETFLGVIADLDLVLASDPHFLLGLWLEAAKSWGTTDSERSLFEYNARNQITLWGPAGEIRDYASKEWAGLVKNFYYKRWSMFLEDLISTVMAGERWNQSAFNQKVFKQVEQPFTFARDTYPTEPAGDSVQIAADLYEKYAYLLDDSFSRELLQLSEQNRKWKVAKKLQNYGKFVVSMEQN